MNTLQNKREFNILFYTENVAGITTRN